LVWQSLVPRARGEFIASVDADDISMPDHFERMISVLRDDERVGLVHSAGWQIDENSNLQNPLFGLEYSYNESSQLRDFMYQCLVAHSTILMRREAFDRVGTFEDGFATDYQFWMKMAKHYRFRYLPEALIRYRVHSGGSSRTAWRDDGARTRRDERRRASILDLYPSLSGSLNPRDFAAAHVDLGLRFVRGLVDTEMAYQEFDNAIVVTDGNCPEAEWNRVLLLLNEGHQDQANARLAELEARYPGFAAPYLYSPVTPFAEGFTMSRVPFELLPHALENTITCWDGSLASIQRVLLLHDGMRPQLTSAAIDAFVGDTKPSEKLELCIATLGEAEQVVLEQVQQSGIPLPDMSQGAPITIEKIDHESFVPAARYVAIADMRSMKTPAEAQKAISDAVKVSRAASHYQRRGQA
jgi:hypothetical protein